MNREVVLFLWWEVNGVEGNLRDVLFKESQIKRSEFDIQCEIGINDGEVAHSDQIFALVTDVESARDSFEGGATVPRGEIAIDFQFVGQRLYAINGGEQNVSHGVRCFPGKGVERSGNIRLSNQLCDIKFCVVNPFVANAPRG